MKRYKVVATAECEVVYYIDAETPEEARSAWDIIDPSLGEVNEDSIDNETFKSITEIGNAPKTSRTVWPGFCYGCGDVIGDGSALPAPGRCPACTTR